MPRTRFASRQRLAAQSTNQYPERDAVEEEFDTFEELKVKGKLNNLVEAGQWGYLPPGNEI